MQGEYKTLSEFWPFYLGEHSSSLNRKFHFVGSTLALFFLGLTIITLEIIYIPAAIFSGYFFAWMGHFLIEKNRPATFKYPLKSLASDWIMYYYTITGQINSQLKHYNIQVKP